MKRIFRVLAVLLALSLTGSFAYAFTSGSTGSDGAFNPTSNTQLQLPPDGVFNFTTVDIPLGVTVTFIRNATNTPVYILATGDVTIDGTIDVSAEDAVSISGGKGGPGGFDGGYGGGNGKGGNGLGPGGGAISNATDNSQDGGGGGFGSPGQNGTGDGGLGGPTYSNVRIVPLIGGSGGAGGNFIPYYGSAAMGGGGGGGAILIASSGTINVAGSIIANGGNGLPAIYICGAGGGGGSGGAIRLIANTIGGNGTISAVGGKGDVTCISSGNGGSGRIRLEANNITRTATSNPVYTSSTPGSVFVANIPAIQITSIGGITVPQNPTGSYGTPDISLPAGTTNPVEVDLSASNIPVGTTITVSVVPQSGVASSSVSSALTGTQQSSTATASVNLSSTETCVLMAETTFNIQTAMNYNGEKITKATVVSSMGGGSQVTYITASGKRVPAARLYASLMK